MSDQLLKKLQERLEKIETEQQRHRSLESNLSLRERLFERKKLYVRDLTRRYLWAREYVIKLGGNGFTYREHNAGPLNHLRCERGIELIHLCRDFEVMVESLAWGEWNRRETEEGRVKRLVFIKRELEGFSEYVTAAKLGISRRRARRLWEECIEELWDKLADYDPQRSNIWDWRPA